MFDPKTNKYPYPEQTDVHYLNVKKNDGTVFDSNYPYIDESKKFLRKKAFTRFLLRLVVFPVARVRLGLRIKGRENLKKHKEELKKGVISVSNHVHMWDYIAVMRGICPFKPYVLVWAPNIRGENGKMMRSVGGVPIPDEDYHGLRAQTEAVGKMLDAGGWLHIYPEGSMWEYYRPIRPFKVGAAYLACRTGKPVLPLAFTYRRPGWLRRKVFHQIALFTLNIGQPLYADESLPRREKEKDLTERCHEAVCALARLTPEERLYEPLFNDSKRVDYYTETYGVGYKGSW